MLTDGWLRRTAVQAAADKPAAGSGHHRVSVGTKSVPDTSVHGSRPCARRCAGWEDRDPAHLSPLKGVAVRSTDTLTSDLPLLAGHAQPHETVKTHRPGWGDLLKLQAVPTVEYLPHGQQKFKKYNC